MNGNVESSAARRGAVCLLGASLDTGNMGVSALAASLIKLVLRSRPESNICLLIGNRSSRPQELRTRGGTISVDVVNYRLSPRSKIHEHLVVIFLLACACRALPFRAFRKWVARRNRWIGTLAAADFVGDINGGDSFSDIYGLRRFIVGSMPAVTALVLKKDLVLLPQTYGPYKSFVARAVARFILKRSARIISRDRESAEIVTKLLGKHSSRKNIRFCPDVAFTLESVLPDKIDIHPPVSRGGEKPVIGINVNGLMYNGGYSKDNMFDLELDYRDFISLLLKRVLEKSPGDVLLVPHTFGPPGNINSDPDACRSALESLPDGLENRVHLVMEKHDQCGMKGIIGLCDFFIGSRMHSCIAALSQGIPTVGVAYSKKFAGVFNLIGLGDMVVDARRLDSESALEKVMSCYENRKEASLRMKEIIASSRETVFQTFKEILANGEETVAGTSN